MDNGPTPLSMTCCRGFVRPRYMLIFTEQASPTTLADVRGWLEDAGINIVLAAQAEAGRPASFVVSTSRELLEREAERLGYLKPHKALAPHVIGQCCGKIEFEREPLTWVGGYLGYEDPEFWSPCERSQLFGSLLSAIPAPPNLVTNHMHSLLRFLRSEHCTFSGGFVTSLKLLGLLHVVVPMDDGLSERTAIWKTGCLAPVPVNDIQHYFGAGVALYFAWMTSYTHWLLLPAASGILCHLHETRNGYTVDDHPWLPFHSLFTVLWSVAFLCNWERVCVGRTWSWSVYGTERVQEVRPEFVGVLRKSPISGDCERYYPAWRRRLKYVLSAFATGVMLCIAFYFHICSLNLQGFMTTHVTYMQGLFYMPALAKWSAPGAIFDPNQERYWGAFGYIPVLFHTLVVRGLNQAYRWVAEKLTQIENHRLAEDFENSLIFKRVFFEAFDSYIGLCYLAFCAQDLLNLRLQLSKLFCMDSARRVVLETILPMVRKIAKRQTNKEWYSKLKGADRDGYAEALHYLDQPEYDRFEDFLEMVLEFGYITLFASAFPLAGAVAIICNVIEMKSDLFKLTRVCRRPWPERTATIGAWKTVLRVLASFSIFSNMVIFLVSEQLASWAPALYREATTRDVQARTVAQIIDAQTGEHDLVVRYGYGFHVVLIGVVIEHLVVAIVLMMVWSIPSVPDWVANEVGRLAVYKERQAKAMRRHEFSRASRMSSPGF